jgi:hypothetical protein
MRLIIGDADIREAVAHWLNARMRTPVVVRHFALRDGPDGLEAEIEAEDESQVASPAPSSPELTTTARALTQAFPPAPPSSRLPTSPTVEQQPIDINRAHRASAERLAAVWGQHGVEVSHPLQLAIGAFLREQQSA